MLIRELFISDVTRDIPPVVYFHEQSAEKLAAEASEYIITGGWPDGHPNHRRVPNGIHEQYVRLLSGITTELDKPGGPDLPNAWISGFYGSGKSSFAKLLGLALDGVALPDGTSLTEAWLRRDTSPKSHELRAAWSLLRQKVNPIAVVFDVGGVARDNEHIHSAVVRQTQTRLGYCTSEPLVADFELNLERDGEWANFEKIAQQTLGKPWSEVKDRNLAMEDFSFVMSVMFPERYTDPMAWFVSRAGTHTRSESPEEAVAALRDMLRFRSPDSTLFVVVDEVSQYILAHKDRVDRLRAFATALGAGLKGKVWLLALGQQKLDEDADDGFLVWAKDRFPPRLRVHLATTNIRDVVHRRLLQKRPEVEGQLREMFEKNRASLKLFAYGCEGVTPEEFVEVYPMLPGHIDLLLQITTALRTRSSRAQGDDQAIRGLLQLLGELFRDQKLADKEFGALVTLDQIYEIQHTALDSDVQDSMTRILNQCADDASGLLVRVAKAVSLLELIQDTIPTDPRLVAQCLYDRVDRGSIDGEVTEALEELRRRNLLGYSEKHGYKVQSSAGEEWERTRRDIGVPRETISELVQDALKYLMGIPKRPHLENRSFPWAAVFSDGRRFDDITLVDPREDAVVKVDLRFLTREERDEVTWVKRSVESTYENRLVWLCGDMDLIDTTARELARSRGMVKKYKPRRESLNAARKLLLQQEENRSEDLDKRMREVVAAVWMKGRIYFRARSMAPDEQGLSFAAALQAAGTRVLPELFPHFISTSLVPSELLQLVESELSGPSPKLLPEELGILELDGARFVPSCEGVVPRRIEEFIIDEDGIEGTTLLAHFGGPPYGYTTNVIKACVAGLLRATRVRLQPEGVAEITAVRDAGVRDVFDKDRTFRRMTILPAKKDLIGVQGRARICKFFKARLQVDLDREDHAIADAVALHFPTFAARQRDVLTRLNRLPDTPEAPPALVRLGDALEECLRLCRQTKPTVERVLRHLDTLSDGIQLLSLYHAELTEPAINAVRQAALVRDHQAAQLKDLGLLTPEAHSAAERIRTQLAMERPWRDIASLTDDLAIIRADYARERSHILSWQEQETNAIRAQLKSRKGFSTLTGEQSHQVLRPLSRATTDTTPEAIAPSLRELKDPFLLTLRRADEQAIDVLDEILSAGNDPIVVKVALSLRNREVATEADVDALVSEIRTKLLEQIKTGSRVRIL